MHRHLLLALQGSVAPCPSHARLHRFLQHMLPRGFHRVRSYGWLAPAAKARFEKVCTLLGALCAPKPLRLKMSAVSVDCPHCKKPMRRIANFSRAPT